MESSEVTIIKPQPFGSGATIGVIAPAGAVQQDVFHHGVDILKAMGYGVRLAEGLFDTDGYLAGSIEGRVNQIHSMFGDSGVDALMCARGGFGSLHLLSLIDYELIRNNPKPFIGFSDITALHHVFYSKAGLVSFHGPMVSTIGTSDDQTRTAWQQAMSTHQLDLYSQTKLQPIKPGKAEGILAGGNLSTLCHLLGTPFSPTFKDRILLIEEINEAPYRIDRMLTQMKMSGCFEGISGVLLGTFTDCGADKEILELVEKVFRDIEVPILAGMAAGHGKRNLTLPLGVKFCLDADRGALCCLEIPFYVE